MPEVLEIWVNSRNGDRLRKSLKEATDFENKYKTMMADGKCTMDLVGDGLEPMDHVIPEVRELKEKDP
jgi:hypothetical protein